MNVTVSMARHLKMVEPLKTLSCSKNDAWEMKLGFPLIGWWVLLKDFVNLQIFSKVGSKLHLNPFYELWEEGC